MIATCPACGKRYRLADDAVPAAGRSVRCAACGHGWTAYPYGEPPAAATVETAEPPPAAAVPPAATAPLAAPVAAPAVATADLRYADMRDVMLPPRRRHLGWIAAVVALLAVAALAVVEFAPADTFDPPRLGLPAAKLPLADLGSLALPDLPSFDPAQVPLVGDALGRWLAPSPASPLRVTATGERRRLANGTWLLTVTGTVANPTAAPLPLAGIDAALADPAGRVAFRWRIPAPASLIPAHASAGFESVAANFPAAATVLRLRAR